eukprot:scaffold546553_cov18-Prasinocladus_malaysianus.AAC.1
MDEPRDGKKSTSPSPRPAAAPLHRLRLLQAGGVPLARSVSHCMHDISRACQVVCCIDSFQGSSNRRHVFNQNWPKTSSHHSTDMHVRPAINHA